MITQKEILNQLPSSWSEMKLKDFTKLVDVQITESVDPANTLFVGTDNIIKVISALTDTDEQSLEDLPYYQLAELSTKLAFLQTLPEARKTSNIKWKKLEDVKFNDYITFQNLGQEQLQNLATIIKAFSQTELTEEQINNLDMVEVVSCFFTLKKHVLKSLKGMAQSSRKLLMKQVVKERWNKLRHFRKRTVK